MELLLCVGCRGVCGRESGLGGDLRWGFCVRFVCRRMGWEDGGEWGVVGNFG